jgi:hypothetical protein
LGYKVVKESKQLKGSLEMKFLVTVHGFLDRHKAMSSCDGLFGAIEELFVFVFRARMQAATGLCFFSTVVAGVYTPVFVNVYIQSLCKTITGRCAFGVVKWAH